MQFELENFSLKEMTLCGRALRRMAQGADSIDQVAEKVVRYLYDSLCTPDGEHACVLVRCFQTTTFAHLDQHLKELAREALDGQQAIDAMKCMCLLATAGLEESWNDCRKSVRHQVIPLSSKESVIRLPMITQLIRQFGLEVGAMIEPDPKVLVDLGQTTFNVFHVPRALGSPYIPDQRDFIEKYGIESVLGFGGLFPNGELFAVILFSRVPISSEVAGLFKPLALSAKVALLPLVGVRPEPHQQP